MSRILSKVEYDKLPMSEKDKLFSRWIPCTDWDKIGKYQEVYRRIPKQQYNESFEHHECKMASYAIAWMMYKCKYIGKEIFIGKTWGDKELTHNGRTYKNKDIIDVVGVTRSSYDDRVVSYGFEAKATIADYRNGFGNQCDYTYIVCPRDVIQKEDLPKGIGLIWVDVDNWCFVVGRKDSSIHGVEVIKRASKRDPKYRINVEILKDRINGANTINNVFGFNMLKRYSKKKR